MFFVNLKKNFYRQKTIYRMSLKLNNDVFDDFFRV